MPAAAPWWCWPILAASVLAVSSAAVVFATMSAVPAVTLAAWRLQLTAAFLLFGAAVQYRRADARTRAHTLASAPLLAASGGWLALHFALWVASLQLTSLPHSVLIISLSPVLLVLHARLVGGPGAVAPGEAWGVALAAAGAAVLSAGAASAKSSSSSSSSPSGSTRDVPASLLGDACAFAGCVSVLGYLLIGRRLRSPASGTDGSPPPLPLCLYAAPVTTVAAVLLTIVGALFESPPPSPAEGVFGWLASGGGGASYGPRVLYLALGPGIVGHTGFNFLLAHVAPLAVSLALDLECVVAPTMARLVGVTKAPLGATTWVGGAMLVAAAVIVTVAGARREAAAAQAAQGGLAEEVAMARLPTHDEDEEEEQAPAPLFSLAGDGDDDEAEAGKNKAVALAPEWAGVHRHRQ
jgi:drug/metabolite transporter (DMT)-like permease